MSLNCEQCGAPIPSDNINIERLVAKCSTCGAVFNFESQLEKRKNDALEVDEKPKRKPKAFREVPLPTGMTAQSSIYDLIITRDWRSAALVALIPFALFWNGFMCVWYTAALSSRQWSMAAFGVLHLSVGIGLGYAVLTGLLNKTTIKVDKMSLSITHGPIPSLPFMSPTVQIDPTTLDQLYVKEHISSSSRRTSRSYEVVAITVDNRMLSLVKNLPDAEQAHYVEQEIEKFLTIEDEPIAAEHRLSS